MLKLLCCFFGSFFSFSNVLFALTAFDNCLSDSISNKFYCTDSIIVTGDNCIDFIGISVGINNSDNRNTKFLSFLNCNSFFAGVNDEHSAGDLLHLFDTAEEFLKLFNL